MHACMHACMRYHMHMLEYLEPLRLSNSPLHAKESQGMQPPHGHPSQHNEEYEYQQLSNSAHLSQQDATNMPVSPPPSLNPVPLPPSPAQILLLLSSSTPAKVHCYCLEQPAVTQHPLYLATNPAAIHESIRELRKGQANDSTAMKTPREQLFCSCYALLCTHSCLGLPSEALLAMLPADIKCI